MRSIWARSWSVARLMKGKSARLRARRTRLLMTMSASGPEPRNHSPLWWVRSFSSTMSPRLLLLFLDVPDGALEHQILIQLILTEADEFRRHDGGALMEELVK